ncbi:MAG: hypothetical protein WC342_09100 [Methanoregula sp.]|jgi:hypothetical protein
MHRDRHANSGTGYPVETAPGYTAASKRKNQLQQGNKEKKTMAKKKPVPEKTGLTRIVKGGQAVIALVNENKTWFYIAVIGFCLSVTAIYKFFLLYGI